LTPSLLSVPLFSKEKAIVKIAVFLPTKVVELEGKHFAESYVPNQLVGLRESFQTIDLIAFLSREKKELEVSYQRIDPAVFRVRGLPSPRDGLDLHVNKLPRLACCLARLFRKELPRWDAMIVYEGGWDP